MEWRELKDKLDYAPKVPPSELFRNQVMATFEEDALGTDLIPLLGADRCMWASDYPHTDSTFPNSRAGDRRDARCTPGRRRAQAHRHQLRRPLRLPARRLTGLGRVRQEASAARAATATSCDAGTATSAPRSSCTPTMPHVRVVKSTHG